MPAARKIIGARLRNLREEPRDRYGRARWSREKWAIKLRHASPNPNSLPAVTSLAKMIQQWERGDHIPGPIYRPLYAHLTGKSETELFAEADEPVRSRWNPSGMDGFPSDDVQRLILASARPERTDTAVVESLASVLAAQRRLEDSVGSAPLISPVRAQLAGIDSMVTDARGYVRPRLLSVAAQWAQFAGWLHISTGQPDDALDYLGRTLRWATEIGDRQLIGAVMSWQGYIAERRGQIGTMIGLSQAGQRIRQGSVGRVYDLYQEARAHAIMGVADEVVRLTDIAAAEADEAEPEAARPWEYYYFAPGFFGLEHGTVYRILGRTDPTFTSTAIEHLTAGLEGLSPEMRTSEWAGDFVYQLARAYQQIGASDEAERVTGELEEITVRIGSERLAGLLSALR